ncbi:hypothetical protein C6N29_02940 [Flavobacterium columnare]|nr:hypothetical protein [Flavobacterium columnare]MBF6659338.1 hypothetical protein [Flavobacterium columnare]PTD16579.1 hypothetical protein C6N29_02940 [Flavobacterium columnare]
MISRIDNTINIKNVFAKIFLLDLPILFCLNNNLIIIKNSKIKKIAIKFSINLFVKNENVFFFNISKSSLLPIQKIVVNSNITIETVIYK